MIVLDRDPANPLLKPNLEHDWESYATFNGSILKDQNTYHLLYRAMGKEQDYQSERLHLSVIGHAVSTDGKIFAENHPLIMPEERWELYGCEDPRVVKIDGTYIIFYTALSEFPPTPTSIKIAIAEFESLEEMWSTEYCRRSYLSLDTPVLPLQRMNSHQLAVGAPPVAT